MKKLIVSQISAPQVRESEIDTDKYFGVQIGTKEHAFIGRIRMNTELTVVKDITTGNSYPGLSPAEATNDLTKFISHLRNRHNKKVYQFDTFAELAKWMDESEV